MTTAGLDLNAFTDAPQLRAGWLRRCAQLMGWLFLHPSAWRKHIARIDPALDPDLALAELSSEHWRNPALQHLLIATALVWPTLAAILGVALMVAGISAGGITFGISIGLAFGIFFALFVGAAAGFANGLAGGSMSALVLGLWGGGAYDTFVHETSGMVFEHPFRAFVDHGFGVALGLAGCAATGIAASVAWTTSTREGRSFASSQALQLVAEQDHAPPGKATASSRLPRLARSSAVWILTLVCGSSALLQATTIADSGVPLGLLYGIVFGLVYSSLLAGVFGLAVWLRTHSWTRAVRTGGACIAGGLFSGVAGGLAYDPVGGVPSSGMAYYVAIGMTTGTATASLFVLSYVLARRRIGPWAGVVAGAFAGCGVYPALMAAGYPLSIAFALTIAPVTSLLGATLFWWRPVLLYPLLALWNLALYIGDMWRATGQTSLLRWNSAFWDEEQRLPLLNLSAHLEFVALRSRFEAAAALEYLAHTHQHRAVEDAQIGLDAGELERCTNLEAIARHRLAPRELGGPVSAVLREFSGISRDVAIVLNHPSLHYRRLELERIGHDLDNVIRALNLSSNSREARFRPAAAAWKQLIAHEVRTLSEQLVTRREISNPYVVGVPLTEAEEIFTGRSELSQRIAAELAKPHGGAMLLYGQRRIGKTSLLRNLSRLLPRSVVPLLVDLQGVAARAADDASFLYNLARGMCDSLEALPALYRHLLVLRRLTREDLAYDPFTRFDEWLDELQASLDGYDHSSADSPDASHEGQGHERLALLALDEFESLDAAFGQGRLDATRILGVLRNVIQHRRRMRVLLAGSHSLEEFEHWAAALVNVQVFRLGYLTDTEARQLIERPTHDFGLEYAPDATERVLALTRGHPCLVQLLCHEVVELKNQQPAEWRHRVQSADVEAAVRPALDLGRMLFADIEHDQVNPTGAAVLRRLAGAGERALTRREELTSCCRTAVELDSALNALQRRELVEAVDGAYRVQVELIRRWFA